MNDDFLLPTHVPTSVANFFPKMNKIVDASLDDHSRYSSTSLAHKYYSIAQLSFIIAKPSSFILKKKQYKYFPATTDIPDEINQALLKPRLSFYKL